MTADDLLIPVEGDGINNLMYSLPKIYEAVICSFLRQDPTVSEQDCTLLIPTLNACGTDEWIKAGLEEEVALGLRRCPRRR